MTPSQYAKAITGSVLAGLTALGTAIADGKVSGAEWVGIVIAVVATFGGVFGVTNAAAPVRKRGEAGAVNWTELLAALLCFLVVLAIVWVVLHGF